MQTSNLQPSTFHLQPVAFVFLGIVLFSASLPAEVPGRVTYRDGSPCAYCWLKVQLADRSLKVRVDGEGYFKLEIETPDQIKRMRARDLSGDRYVENGFLFLFLRRPNPQLRPVISELRKRLQTYRVSSSSVLIQQVIVENCYLIIERDSSYLDGLSTLRTVEVDLNKLEVLEVCPDEQACIRFQPARLLGERSPFDQGGAAVFFDAKHKGQAPGLLYSIAHLARTCGNSRTRVNLHEGPPLTVSSGPG